MYAGNFGTSYIVLRIGNRLYNMLDLSFCRSHRCSQKGSHPVFWKRLTDLNRLLSVPSITSAPDIP